MPPGRRDVLRGGSAAAAGAVLGGAPRTGVAEVAGTRLDRSRLEPTFSDDFDVFSRWNGQSGTWRTVLGPGGPLALDNRTLRGGRQKQVFMDPEFAGPGGGEPLGIDPFHVEGGVLRIEARPTPPEARPRLWGYPYTSGVITTKFSFTQLYGYFEVRAKLPAGRGLWPAFWLLPADSSWPPELDVMEVLGHQMDTLVATIHVRAGYRASPAHVVRGLPDLSADFHTYGASWDGTEVRWYFDDREVARQPTPAEMDKPMFMLVNLGVGGDWPGDPDGSTRFPAHMLVDWVRAWRVRT